MVIFPRDAVCAARGRTIMTIRYWAQSPCLRARNIARHGVLGLVFGALSLTVSIEAASAANRIPSPAVWRDRIAELETPGEGCFTADYPKLEWERIACGPAPKITRVPPAGVRPNTVGNGNDYTAAVSGRMLMSRGTFPFMHNVTTEHDSGNGYSDTYSLQLNSQAFSGSPMCAGAKDPAKCQAWQQFTFLNEGSGPNPFGAVTMQYWLLDYNKACPKGWHRFIPHCVRNSQTVYLGLPQPTIDFQYISDLTLTATAVAGGNDKVVLTTKAKAYSVGAKDSEVDLGQFWNATEFNAFGINGGSDAIINSGSLIKVRLAVKDSGGTTPACVGNSGTTAEGNNMTLGSCVAAGNLIQFSESN
jgi:hypothetical protein